jgi:hypothetical protein
MLVPHGMHTVNSEPGLVDCQLRKLARLHAREACAGRRPCTHERGLAVNRARVAHRDAIAPSRVAAGHRANVRARTRRELWV